MRARNRIMRVTGTIYRRSLSISSTVIWHIIIILTRRAFCAVIIIISLRAQHRQSSYPIDRYLRIAQRYSRSVIHHIIRSLNILSASYYRDQQRHSRLPHAPRARAIISYPFSNHWIFISIIADLQINLHYIFISTDHWSHCRYPIISYRYHRTYRQRRSSTHIIIIISRDPALHGARE